MATNISTDIAQEINITARRGDTFYLGLSVVESETANSYDLSGQQTGNTVTIASAYSSTGFTTAITYADIYQAKMTIKKEGSEFDVLSVYSFMWQDLIFNNVLPNLNRAGKYRGEDETAQTNKDVAGIFLKSSAGGLGELISIRIPNVYMNMSPGSYVYDFQVRKKLAFNPPHLSLSGVDAEAEYTTWFKGIFTVVNDITKA